MDNISLTGPNVTLEELNSEEAFILFPVFVFSLIMIFIGVFGNLHVFIVCRGTYKKNSTFKVFILFLATVDIITCLTTMPFEAITMAMPFTFTFTNVCKSIRYLNMALISSSSFLLVIISIERYKRVCQPLKPQITLTKAKVLCSVAIFFAFFVSIPYGIFQGDKKVALPNNITGIECTTSDHYNSSIFRKMFSTSALLIFFFNSSLIICLFILIGKSVRLQNYKRSTMIGLPSKKGNKQSTSSTMRRGNGANGQNRVSIISNLSYRKQTHAQSAHQDQYSGIVNYCDKTGYGQSTMEVDSDSKVIALHFEAKETRSQTCLPITGKTEIISLSEDSLKPKGLFSVEREDKVNNSSTGAANKKVTYILFLNALLFIVSFLPFLVMEALDSTAPMNLRRGHFRVIYHFCLRTYYINSVLNPVIYCFYDQTFRDHLKAIYSTCIFLQKRRM